MNKQMHAIFATIGLVVAVVNGLPLDADATTIGSTISDAVQTTFMANLPAVVSLIAVLLGVGLVIRLVRKNAKP